MGNTLLVNRSFWAIAIPSTILIFLIVLMQSSDINDTLSLAISADLLLTVPLVYLLLIRKTTIPKTTVIPVLFLGLLLGFYFLPKENQNYLLLFKTWGLPFIELGILTFVVFNVYRAIKKYKGIKGATPDFYTALKNTCEEILPSKLVMPVVTEIAVIYYSFIHWRRRTTKDLEFTYHKKSGATALWYALILIIFVEIVAIHFLVALWSDTAAWILSILSLYTGMQVFGLARSLSKRPISINDKSVSLKYGIINEVDIPLVDIEVIELSRKKLDKDKLTVSLSPLGELESHNVIIKLKKEHHLRGFYGLKKNFNVIALYVDEAQKFKQTIKETMN